METGFFPVANIGLREKAALTTIRKKIIKLPTDISYLLFGKFNKSISSLCRV